MECRHSWPVGDRSKPTHHGWNVACHITIRKNVFTGWLYQTDAVNIWPACAQVGELSPLCFNLRHFSNWSSQATVEAVLSLLNLFSLKRLPLLRQFHILHFYVLLFFVLHFHVCHFHVRHFQRPRHCNIKPQKRFLSQQNSARWLPTFVLAKQTDLSHWPASKRLSRCRYLAA